MSQNNINNNPINQIINAYKKSWIWYTRAKGRYRDVVAMFEIVDDKYIIKTSEYIDIPVNYILELPHVLAYLDKCQPTYYEKTRHGRYKWTYEKDFFSVTPLDSQELILQKLDIWDNMIEATINAIGIKAITAIEDDSVSNDMIFNPATLDEHFELVISDVPTSIKEIWRKDELNEEVIEVMPIEMIDDVQHQDEILLNLNHDENNVEPQDAIVDNALSYVYTTGWKNITTSMLNQYEPMGIPAQLNSVLVDYESILEKFTFAKDTTLVVMARPTTLNRDFTPRRLSNIRELDITDILMNTLLTGSVFQTTLNDSETSIYNWTHDKALITRFGRILSADSYTFASKVSPKDVFYLSNDSKIDNSDRSTLYSRLLLAFYHSICTCREKILTDEERRYMLAILLRDFADIGMEQWESGSIKMFLPKYKYQFVSDLNLETARDEYYRKQFLTNHRDKKIIPLDQHGDDFMTKLRPLISLPMLQNWVGTLPLFEICINVLLRLRSNKFKLIMKLLLYYIMFLYSKHVLHSESMDIHYALIPSLEFKPVPGYYFNRNREAFDLLITLLYTLNL